MVNVGFYVWLIFAQRIDLFELLTFHVELYVEFIKRRRGAQRGALCLVYCDLGSRSRLFTFL